MCYKLVVGNIVSRAISQRFLNLRKEARETLPPGNQFQRIGRKP